MGLQAEYVYGVGPEYEASSRSVKRKHLRMNAGVSIHPIGSWRQISRLEGGDVHISAIPLSSDRTFIGFVVLIHDLGFAQRRESRTQIFLISAFAVLALLAAVLTLTSAKVLWRGWSNALRRR